MGIVTVESAEQLTLKDLKAAQLDKERADIKNAPESLKLDLIAHVRKAWERAQKEKMPFQQQMIKNLNQRAGEYESDKLADIRQMGGSEIYMKITDTKCRSLIAWVKDILFQPGATPFGLDHAPIPSLTPEAEQEAQALFMQEANSLAQLGAPLDEATINALMPKFKKRLEGIRKEIAQERADEMSDRIESQLIDGGFYKALSKLIALITIFKAGFIKGPIYRKKKVRDDIVDAEGRVRPGVKEEIIPEWESPSAMDIYPMPGAIGIDDGDLIEIIHYTRSEIQSMIGIDGFDEVAIREVLGHFYDKGLHEWTWDDQQRAAAEGRNADNYYDWDKIDCIELNGHIPGRMLLQWAELHTDLDEKGKIKKQMILGHEIDPDLDYLCTAWVIDRWILKVAINDNALERKYYYKVSFVENENGFWGDSLCETIPDPQSACNSIARALQNNCAIASGPLVGLNEKLLVPGEKPDKIWPWRVFRFVMGAFGRTEPPIQFWQAAMHITELVAGYNHFSKIADEECGVPGWAHGDPQVGGSGNTSSGLSMLMGASSRGVKEVIRNIDSKIIAPIIEDLYYINFEMDEDLEYIGNVKVIARGSSFLQAKEQMVLRLNDFLRATDNPTDFQLMGPDGRRYALREIARSMNLEPDKLVPDTELSAPFTVPGQTAPPPGMRGLDNAGNLMRGAGMETMKPGVGQAPPPGGG